MRVRGGCCCGGGGDGGSGEDDWVDGGVEFGVVVGNEGGTDDGFVGGIFFVVEGCPDASCSVVRVCRAAVYGDAVEGERASSFSYLMDWKMLTFG